MSHITQKKIGRDKFDTLDYYILVFSFFILFFKTFLVDQPTIYIYISINFFLHFFLRVNPSQDKTVYDLHCIFPIKLTPISSCFRRVNGRTWQVSMFCHPSPCNIFPWTLINKRKCKGKGKKNWHIMWCCFSSNNKSSNALTYEGSCTIYWL